MMHVSSHLFSFPATHFRKLAVSHSRNNAVPIHTFAAHLPRSTGPVNRTRQRPIVATAASANKDPPEDDGDSKARLQAELRVLLALIVQYPAVRGTIAVLGGWYAHIQPLGTLHWDAQSAIIGLLFAVPMLFTDAFIMGPSWEPERTTKKMRLMVPRPVAERLMKVDQTAVIIEQPKRAQANARGISADDLHSDSTSAVGVNIRSNGNGVAALDEGHDATNSPTASTDRNSGKQTEERISTNESCLKTSTMHSNRLDTYADATPAAASTVNVVVATTDDEEGGVDDTRVNSPELVEVERDVTLRADQHPFKAALYRMQTERTLNNPGRILSLPSESLLLVLVHVSEEMLYRGFMLTLAVLWITDRLYEAGVDEHVLMPGGIDLAVPQLGALLAATGMTVTAVGLVVQQNLFPLRLLEKAAKSINKQNAQRGSGSETKSEEDEHKARRKRLILGLEEESDENGAAAERKKESREDAQRLAQLLSQARDAVVDTQRWTAAVKAVDELVQWSMLSTSFLLTGNILAPIAGSIFADAVYSMWQRGRARELEKAMKERAQLSTTRMQQRRELIEAVKEHRKSKAGSQEESGIGGDGENQQQQGSANRGDDSHTALRPRDNNTSDRK